MTLLHPLSGAVGRLAAMLAALVAPGLVHAQAATFDPGTGVLRIPAVAVGNQVYVQVELRDRGQLQLALQSAVERRPAGPLPDVRFDAAQGTLIMPLVRVGEANFRDVKLRHLGNYVFEVQSATPTAGTTQVTAPSRRVEVISSVDTTSVRGTYEFASLDPLGAAAPVPVASSFASLVEPRILRVRGGGFDPDFGVVRSPFTRHLLYRGESSMLRVGLDAGAALAAQRVSSAVGAAQAIAAQSATGDDALIRYSDAQGGYLFAWLSDGSAVAPRVAPEGVNAVQPPHAQLDPVRGTVQRLFWLTNDRLVSTDRDFGNRTEITVPGSRGVYALDPERPTPLARGFLFRSGTEIYRFDYVSNSVRTVFRGPTQEAMELGKPLVDHEAAHIPVNTAAGMMLLRCLDAPSVDCTVLASAEVVAARKETLSLRQTRDFVILPLRPNGAALSIRKADGATFTLSVPAATSPFLPDWTAGQLAQRDQPSFVGGNRVFYARTDRTLGSLIGSINADGTDLREHPAGLTAIRALPAAVPPHLLATTLDNDLPIGALLVARPPGQTATEASLYWIDGATGDAGPVVGTIPATLARTQNTFGVAVPFSVIVGSEGGVIGLAANVRPTPGALEVRRVDSFVVGRGADSLVRLTRNIP